MNLCKCGLLLFSNGSQWICRVHGAQFPDKRCGLNVGRVVTPLPPGLPGLPNLNKPRLKPKLIRHRREREELREMQKNLSRRPVQEGTGSRLLDTPKPRLMARGPERPVERGTGRGATPAHPVQPQDAKATAGRGSLPPRPPRPVQRPKGLLPISNVRGPKVRPRREE